MSKKEHGDTPHPYYVDPYNKVPGIMFYQLKDFDPDVARMVNKCYREIQMKNDGYAENYRDADTITLSDATDEKTKKALTEVFIYIRQMYREEAIIANYEEFQIGWDSKAKYILQIDDEGEIGVYTNTFYDDSGLESDVSELVRLDDFPIQIGTLDEEYELC